MRTNGVEWCFDNRRTNTTQTKFLKLINMEANVYTQPKLPYEPDALEPSISRSTVEFHYGKHEKAYIDNLNKLIKDTEYADMAIEDIIRQSDGALFNNASQAWNLSLIHISEPTRRS